MARPIFVPEASRRQNILRREGAKSQSANISCRLPEIGYVGIS